MSKIYENRFMKPSWGDFGRILCYLGCKLEVLGLSWRQIWGSWADLGSKMGVWGSILAPKWGPKSMKIAPKSDPKGDHFFDIFLDRLWERFGANLAPTWFPKPSQNGAKLVPWAIPKVIIFLISFWITFWSDLVSTWLHLGPQNPSKMGLSWFQNRCKLGC